ncbi:MAG: DUF1289 domain-containing protein [Pseudomonadales bacterium]
MGMCDLFQGVCTSCFRDSHEITEWHDMSDEQKLKLRAVLELRRKEADALELKSRK